MLNSNIDKKLSNYEINVLNDCLKKSNENVRIKKDIYWADGYLCAIISAPNLVMPSDWQYEFIDQECAFENEKQGYLTYELLMSFYNNINKDIMSKSYIPIYEWYEVEEKTKLKLAASWSRGYMLGTMVASEEFLVGEVLSLLLPIIALTRIVPELELKKNNMSPEEVIDIIPLIVKKISKIYDETRQELILRNGRVSETTVNSDKTGKDELCFCDSGKEYKKCCLDNIVFN